MNPAGSVITGSPAAAAIQQLNGFWSASTGTDGPKDAG